MSQIENANFLNRNKPIRILSKPDQMKEMDKAKICITVIDFPHEGGISAIVEDLIHYFGQKYEVHVLTNKSMRNKSLDISTHLNFQLHYWNTPNLLPVKPIWHLIFATITLWKLTRIYRFRAILAQDGAIIGLSTVLVGRILRVKSVVMDHGTAMNRLDAFFWDNVSHIRGKFFRRLARGIFWLIIGITAWLANELFYYGINCEGAETELDTMYKRGFRVNVNKIKYYKYFINTSVFKPVSNKFEFYQLRKDWKIPNEAVVVNMIARLSPEKGFDYALPALAEIICEYDDLFVIIGGSGPMEGWINEFIEIRKLKDRVKLIGHVPRTKVPDLLRLSDIHLYAGVMSCCFTITVLEAMSCGCVPIATYAPIAHKYVLDGYNGIAIPPKDTNEIKLALKKLLLDKHRLENMKLAARNYILNNHDYKAAGKFYEHI